MQVRPRRDSSRLPSARVPASPPERAKASDKPQLRLSLARGNLALEIDTEVALPPLRVTELRALLPDVRFPVDLTGGVTRFRHRRGALSSVVVELGADDAAKHAAPLLRGLLGPGTPDVLLAPVEDGALVGLASGLSALAFEVLVAPMGGDLRLVVTSARGIGLGAPAFVLSIRALLALTKPLGASHGPMVVLRDVPAELGRHVLPLAGARAPSARGVEMSFEPTGSRNVLRLEAHEGKGPPALHRRVLSALELVDLVMRSDDLAVSGDLDAARAGYLAALERAPRHPEIAMRLAAVDRTWGGRDEAALATVVEALPAIEAGALGAELLAACGDPEGAYAAYVRAGTDEAYGPLAGLCLLAASKLTGDRSARLDALDAALVRAPALLEARWERLSARLALGDVRGATADAEHLEATSSGAQARQLAALRAGHAFAERGLPVEAAGRYERALRYAPSSPDAVLGLARALRETGRSARALDLFARAAELAERAGRPSPACELELARALAEHARDLPAAIARASRVPQQTPEAFEARLWEGRWRAELGDLTGATRALARLREAAEMFPGAPSDRPRVARWLLEAAKLDEHELGDLEAAHRDLALALRTSPRDGVIASELRRVSRLSVERARGVEAERAPRHVPVATSPERSPESALAEPAAPEDIVDESRVEELTAKLRANPSDHAVAIELARVLTLLGRDLELLALLSARIEEGPEHARAELVPMRRAVLARLADAARGDGRTSEAELYELMRDAE